MERRQFLKVAGVSAAACVTGSLASGCQTLVENNVKIDPEGDPSTYSVLSDADVVSFASDVDVLIVGSGIAGLSAAIAPARAGLKALVVEKLATIGGESYLSYGVVRVSGSKFQSSHEVTVTAEAAWEAHKGDSMFKDIKNLKLAERLFLAAPEWVDVLIDDYGAEFASPQEQIKLGVPTNFLFPSSGVGDMLGVMDKLRDGLVKQGVEFLQEYRATSFILDSEKVVQGVRLSSKNESVYYDVRAKRIIMATGGYAANQGMVQAYAPLQLSMGSVTYASDGEGMKMVLAAGGTLADMDTTLPLLGDVPEVSTWGLCGPTIAVNCNGERFSNEDDPYDAPLRCVLKEQCFWWTVFDNQVCEGFLSSGVAETLSTYLRRVVGPCNTIEELALAMNMNEELLKKTFSSYEEIATKQEDKAFGRKLFMKKLKAPYYAIKQVPVRFKSYGGIVVDDNFQPAAVNNDILQNVYCCGSMIASCGDGLSACGASGYLAGNAAVASLSE